MWIAKYLFLLTMLYASRLCAEVTLVQTDSAYAPSSHSDIGYWMNDSTLGLAYERHDTIYWTTDIHQPLQAIQVSIPGRSPDTDLLLGWVRLLRRAAEPDHAFVAVLWQDYVSIGVALLDLTAGITLGTDEFTYDESGQCGGWSCHYATVADFAVWPPPPAACQWVLLATQEESDQDWPPDHWAYRSYGEARVYSVLTDTLTLHVTQPGWQIHPFDDWDSTYFAVSGLHSYSSDVHDNFHIEWLTGIVPEGEIIPLDTLCPYEPPCNLGSIVAQQDVNGTRRIITANGYAFDPETHDVLWQRSALTTGQIVTMRINGSNERVVTASPAGRRFLVFDAFDGTLIDSTTDVSHPGQSTYLLTVIRSPEENDKLVTVSDDYYVRVYAFAPYMPGPRALTVSVVNDAGFPQLRLKWLRAEGADLYIVFRSDEVDGAQQLCTTVPAESTAVTLPAMDSKQFYQVVAQFNE